MAAVWLTPGCGKEPGLSQQEEFRLRFSAISPGAAPPSLLEAAVRSDSANLAVYSDLAGVYASRGEHARAIALYGEILRRYPDSVRAHYNLGQTFFRIGKYDEAIEHFGRTVELVPEFADGNLSLGAAYAQRAPAAAVGSPTKVIQADLDRAIDFCSKAVALEPYNAVYQYNLGRAHHLRNQFAEAAQAYLRALELDSALVEAHRYLGVVYAKDGDWKQAEAEYRAAVLLDDEDGEVHYELGKSLERQSKNEEAVTAYQRAIALKPGFADAHYSLGKVLHRLGRLEESQKEIERFNRLQAQGGQGVKAAKLAVQRHPDGVAERRALSVAYADAGKFAEAAGELRVALTLAPQEAQIHFDLGLVYGRLGQFSDAIEMLKRTVDLAPDSSRYHLRLAQAYSSADLYEPAIAALERALVLNPGFPAARLDLAHLHLRGGRFDQALPLFKRVLADEPDNPAAHWGMGVFHLQASHLPAARAAIERVIALDPDYPRAAELLARLKEELRRRN